MKKKILLILSYLYCVPLFCQEICNEKIETIFFAKWDIPYERYYIGLNNNRGYLISELLFEFPDKISMFYSTSGYYLYLSNFDIIDDKIIFDFIKIWIGAEEIKKSDNRILYKYRTEIKKLIKIHGFWKHITILNCY